MFEIIVVFGRLARGLRDAAQSLRGKPGST